MTARCSTAYEIADHRRDLAKHDPRPYDQRYAVADLVGYCEGLAGSGLLGPILEMQLRQRIAATLVAFNMPSKFEREVADA